MGFLILQWEVNETVEEFETSLTGDLEFMGLVSLQIFDSLIIILWNFYSGLLGEAAFPCLQEEIASHWGYNIGKIMPPE